MTVHLVHPYKLHGVWMYDDLDRGILCQPLLVGANGIIDEITDYPGRKAGISEDIDLFFADEPFDGFMYKFEYMREEAGGYWYKGSVTQKEAWIDFTPKYWDHPPKCIYIALYARHARKGMKADNVILRSIDRG